MSHPQSYRPKSGEVPTEPGVYRFLDPDGRVVYVGKAKNLRARLNSYFANPAGLHPRTFAMVHTASAVQWTVVNSEVEALQLEFTWIKEYAPRFNVMFRDDKSHPYLAFTMQDEYPRAMITRGARKPGTVYFGPYTKVWAIRETLDLLLKAFPVRTCTPTVFRRAEQTGRPCLLGYIDKCAAPCVGRVSAEEHRELAQQAVDFMNGDGAGFIAERKAAMARAAADMDYERAAVLRDEIEALTTVLEKSAVVLDVRTDADVFAMAEDEMHAAVQVFHVRQGRIRGEAGWIVDKVDDSPPEVLTEAYLRQVYGDAEPVAVPREILLDTLPADADTMTEFLTAKRGGRVALRVPQRGEKRAVLDTVKKNAQAALTLHASRRASDLTTRSQALAELQEHLDLPQAPLRIECYDVSHTQGSEVVASMVVFEDGLPKKREYRTFGISGDAARDDTSAMYDVISRRFSRYLEQSARSPQAASGAVTASGASEEGEEPARGGFSYPPSLVVVDGALPQVRAAERALQDLGILDIRVAGLAKRLEELWVPEDDYPLVLPRNSESLFLLQRLRDEAHRFAIAFHRKRRSRAMTGGSALDGIAGLGETRRKALLKTFGSVKRLRQASPEEIAGVKGIGPALAEKIAAHLHRDGTSAGSDKL
ncbi:excinuclease ABC subunit UvrC [Sediminivirga luteola]|uniref:UvrABC system protein C n=1 Tax=Sediminivirga luteola TaxID=1774748 RepID=A0A8J2U177_9MICO|nr:excinuclease ABC subunit UvrC [Sediminivirga luteola]GGA28413.1 UvrABC system protein C [Sediminivirga luteola]